MSSSPRITKAELTGLYGAMIKRMSRKMFGEVPEPVGVAWHNRKVLNLSFSLGRKVQKLDQCDRNLKISREARALAAGGASSTSRAR